MQQPHKKYEKHICCYNHVMKLDKFWQHYSNKRKITVSRESAPSVANLDSPLTSRSSGRANCFFTISTTFFTVSGLAYSIKNFVIRSLIIYLKVHTWLQSDMLKVKQNAISSTNLGKWMMAIPHRKLWNEGGQEAYEKGSSSHWRKLKPAST